VSLSAIDVCNVARITYRQLDYWTRAGYVSPALAVTGSGGHSTLTPEAVAELPERWRSPLQPGSGTIRYYTEAEADVAIRMGRLVRAGFVLAPAARLARAWSTHSAWPLDLGGGMILRLTDAEYEHPHQAEYEAASRAAHQDGR
jgi:DNA-binding transcriptional MerR regulator